MSIRVNADNQIESCKVKDGQEVVHLVADRQEILDVLNRVQNELTEVNQDLADFDTAAAQLAATPAPVVPDPATMATPVAPETPAVPDVPDAVEPVAPVAPEVPAEPEAPAAPVDPATNAPQF